MSSREFLAGYRTRPGMTLRAVIAPARLAAYDVLRAVSTRRADLPAALARARSRLQDERDRALAGEIATGTLRWQGTFDVVIAAYAGRPLETLDAEVVDILRLTLFQLLHLDRVPASAAVNDAVQMTQEGRQDAAPRRSSTRCCGGRAASGTACRCRREWRATRPASSTISSRRCRIRDGWWSAGGRATGSRRPRPGAGSTTSRRR